MGNKTWIFILVVAVLVYQWYPVVEHNILVLANSSTVDVSKLAQIKNLKAVFKIDQNIDEHMGRNNENELKTKSQWNLALIIKNEGPEGKHGSLRLHSGNDEILDDVLSDIRKGLMEKDFINKIALFPYSENLSITRLYNLCLSLANWGSVKFPKFFKTSFTPLSEEQKEHSNKKLINKLCSPESINAGGRKRMTMINVMKLHDLESWKTYENAMMNYLPQIGTQLFSRGVADSEYWDDIALVSYRSRAKFCEMAISQETLKVADYKRKGLSDTHTYMTYQIIECNDQIKRCAPTDD